MQIKGAAALVTGANRGIGRAFALALLEHGAAKVYAGSRDPEAVKDAGLIPVRLDVTDQDQVAAAAELAGDVTIVINNAGVTGGTGLLDGSFDGARHEMEVNYLGTWAVSRAFAPVLARNGGGALVNMLSLVSWRAMPLAPGYAAAKSAQWSLTNALRVGLAEQGTLVVGVHSGYVDTDLSAWTTAPKIAPEDVAEQTMQALLEGSQEVLADEVSRSVRASLSGPLEGTYGAEIF
ncbi:SDR family oxidoreductase [Planotetraspora kaengkrachanensis]|uniref:Short-chain dehydrogenase n=1 Tax=Planotetraspora kaengkrachanensis TaxID=575193 RepID=A0A8J3PVK8_9ACTN|nr:SDR family oxidoreductase [Planotetraspora kaengkrachanensis]GIG81741.1 short-chain dehydrogenase [Planotetraspora kaengkrachanensis]